MFFFIFFYRNLLNIRNTLYLYEIFYKNILLTLKLFVMNKAELIDAIAAEAKLTKADSKKALDAFIKATTVSLSKGGRVALVGFGSFVGFVTTAVLPGLFCAAFVGTNVEFATIVS